MEVTMKPLDYNQSGDDQPSAKEKRLEQARHLKDYALNSNLFVPDKVLEKLYQATTKSVETPEVLVDEVIRDLTSLTYPTTIETLEASKNPKAQRFVRDLLILSLAVLLLGIVSQNADRSSFIWAPSILAVSLGILGAIVYAFFHMVGLLREGAYDPSATLENTVRIALGGILGWLMYFVFHDSSQGDKAFAFVLLPFLAGFSTRLVFGILNQAVKAIEITLGMEDTSTRMLRRGAAAKTPSGKLPSEN
jgi:hypothetical protein